MSTSGSTPHLASREYSLKWPSSGVLVAETEAGIVGFAGFGPSQEAPAVAEIGTLYAMPKVEGTGIGKHLMPATLTTLVLPVQGPRNGIAATRTRTHGTNSVEHDDGPLSSHRERFSLHELVGLFGCE
ncbi:GNAT family N-acetyltransferase [Streptomyces camelliae]|uniref:GNAT family N-acetyltransferase n=1 Tax=Streptomyces camelliae TaxID=3004093 RepID=A0ABY7NTL1_9ACTN|nr:GNAT family N-acetyltransferase [Streptomyces sp. HUAS 2-6]WBO61566.1 GNAT family N-acetyltransferase [Streptomyces sp. HUAS 2-6]